MSELPQEIGFDTTVSHASFTPYKRLAAMIVMRAIRDLFIVKSARNSLEVRGAAVDEILALLREDARDFLFYDGPESYDFYYLNGQWHGGFTVLWCCDLLDIDINWLRSRVSAMTSERFNTEILVACASLGGWGRSRIEVPDELSEFDDPEPPAPVVIEPISLDWVQKAGDQEFA